MEKYLGAEFYSDPNRNGIANCIDKVERTLSKAKNLHLSLLGRVNVLKSYALPGLYYATSIDTPSGVELRRVKNLVNWFLFSREPSFRGDFNYPSRMSEERMASPVEKGGLGLLPLRLYSAAQKCNWVRRALQKEIKDGWFHGFEELLENASEKNKALIVPPEFHGKTPTLARGDKRSTLLAMVTQWARQSFTFKIDDEIGYVGTLSPKGSIQSVL
jgi:hypothetical protein